MSTRKQKRNVEFAKNWYFAKTKKDFVGAVQEMAKKWKQHFEMILNNENQENYKKNID